MGQPDLCIGMGLSGALCAALLIVCIHDAAAEKCGFNMEHVKAEAGRHMMAPILFEMEKVGRNQKEIDAIMTRETQELIKRDKRLTEISKMDDIGQIDRKDLKWIRYRLQEAIKQHHMMWLDEETGIWKKMREIAQSGARPSHYSCVDPQGHTQSWSIPWIPDPRRRGNKVINPELIRDDLKEKQKKLSEAIDMLHGLISRERDDAKLIGTTPDGGVEDLMTMDIELDQADDGWGDGRAQDLMKTTPGGSPAVWERYTNVSGAKASAAAVKRHQRKAQEDELNELDDMGFEEVRDYRHLTHAVVPRTPNKKFPVLADLDELERDLKVFEEEWSWRGFWSVALPVLSVVAGITCLGLSIASVGAAVGPCVAIGLSLSAAKTIHTCTDPAASSVKCGAAVATSIATAPLSLVGLGELSRATELTVSAVNVAHGVVNATLHHAGVHPVDIAVESIEGEYVKRPNVRRDWHERTSGRPMPA